VSILGVEDVTYEVKPAGAQDQDATADAAIPGDWFDAAWTAGRSLRIHADQVAGELSDFPIYVDLSALDVGVVPRADGADIRFTLGDGTTLLRHEVVIAPGVRAAWVRVPSLSTAADARLYVYYGNTASVELPQGSLVWDDLYAGVWHLDETVGGRSTKTRPLTWATVTGRPSARRLASSRAPRSSTA
jgi:hypothetical protein